MTQAQAQKMDAAAAQGELRNRLGMILKEARDKAGVSIEAVAHETKISKQFIIYLESGNFENLPGQVFGRGFIKNISRYLRSDSKELLKLYDECWGEPKKTVITPNNETVTEAVGSVAPATTASNALASDSVPSAHPRTSDIPDIKHLPSVETEKRGIKISVPTWLVRKVMSQNMLLTILAPIAAIMVIGVFGRWVIAQMQRTAPVTAPTAAVAPAQMENTTLAPDTADLGSSIAVNSNDVAIPANVVEKTIDPQATQIDATPRTATAEKEAVSEVAAPIQGAATPAAPVDVARTSTSEDSPLNVQGTPVAFQQTLEIKVNAPVEMKMIIDGKRTERQMYAAGVTNYTFHDRAELTIQDASQVEVIFNGKSLGTLGNKGRKRKIMFQAKPSESDFIH